MATVFIQKRRRENRMSYVVQYKDSSHRTKYYKTFQKQKEAQQAAYELRKLIDCGKVSEIDRNKGRINLLTFGEVSECLQEKWRSLNEQGNLSSKTYDDYVIRSRALIRHFNGRLLCEISEMDILNHQKTASSNLSNVSSNRDLFIIKQVFKHGLEMRAVIQNVAESISYLSEKQHERNRFILPLELDKLLEASQQIRAKFFMPAMILLGAEHGASKQEILSLSWSDVNFDYNQRGIIRFFRTKNKRERTEYLMPRTRHGLIKWRDHQKWMRIRKRIDPVVSDLVFCRMDGEPIKRFDKSWRAACKVAQINNLHFHDLRHTFCSNLVLSGSNLKDVKEMIGHHDLSMTDRYTHLTLDHKRVCQDKLARHYSGEMSSWAHMGHTNPPKLRKSTKKEQISKSLTCSFYSIFLVGTRGFEPRTP